MGVVSKGKQLFAIIKQIIELNFWITMNSNDYKVNRTIKLSTII